MTEKRKASPSDPLGQCVSYVLRFYDLQPDIDTLQKVLPRASDRLSLEDLPMLAEKLKLELSQGETTLKEVGNAAAPVLVTDQDGGNPKVYVPQSTGEERIFSPAHGVKPCSLEKMPDSPVRVTLLKPSRQSMEADAEHMERKRPIDWFWRPLKRFWSSFAEIIVCSVFINLFVLLIPLFTLNVYDQVIPNFATETLIVLSTGVLIALVFDFLLKTMRTYILERVASRVGSEYDGKLMERMLLIDSEHMRLSVGERANLFRELQGIREFYASKLIPTAVDLPFFLMFMAVIYMISPILTVVPAVGAIAIVAINAAIQIPINRATANNFSSMQKKSTVLMETLSGTSTFKLFNAVGSRLFRWSTVSTHSAESARYNQFLLGVVQNVSLAAVHIVHVLIVVVGVFEIQAGMLTIGGLIACTILSGRAMAPIVNVGSVVSRWQQSRDMLIAVDGLFKLPHEGERAEQSSAAGIDGGITLRNLTYRYPGQQRPALQNISLDIKPGDRVALIGPTGAGKSTTAGLLSGMMQRFEGDLEVDGCALSSISPARLRSSIAFVPQMPFFINGSIRDNVLLGCEDATEEALLEALEISGLDVVIKQTGMGLDTPVGENGSALSGGQRQAVSLARAIVRDPQIIVFDEPTTGLDNSLEARLKQKLGNYLKGRTFIMVTHRTSMLELVDRLVLMDSGRIRADGPRDEVLQMLSGKGPQQQSAQAADQQPGTSVPH